MKNKLALLFLAVASFLPLAWRCLSQHALEPIGLLSDLSLGVFVFTLGLFSPRWLRFLLIVLWAFFQTVANELFAAMQRFPTWQDLHYLQDPSFIENSAAGFNLNEPVLVATILLAAVIAGFLPLIRPRWPAFFKGLGLAILLCGCQFLLNLKFDEQSVAARFNPLHWFVVDALSSVMQEDVIPEHIALPPSMDKTDLAGKPLLSSQGKAKNILIVAMEGMTGLYYPDISKTIGIQSPDVSFTKLAAATQDAMVVPDFVTHSHQTIRGLYSIVCGDFSKQSWDTPKAFELQQNPARTQACLPAQLAQHGWSTHYLQGADLGFMSKDRVMPMVGFQEVHGKEWFKEPSPFPFEWGIVDEVFFRGAYEYIVNLEQKKKPWMLTLLTVGTHQPYAVPDDIAAQYPSRKLATVALLDDAVSLFIERLRKQGVLDDTLVILTSDESHGSNLADWISSWGLNVVLAPDQGLPRIKTGEYGLVDINASIYDYLGIPAPKSIIGRSFFRDYATPRDMVSFTSSKRRWHTADNLRYECGNDGRCRVGKATSLLGPPPELFEPDKSGAGQKLFSIDYTLDHKLLNQQQGSRELQFANGELRKLPEKSTSEWADNLVGAQYLDFPADSKVHVTIRVKAVQASNDGIHLKLLLKEWEKDQGEIKVPTFPVLHKGEESTVQFDFDNPEARQSFSFHFIGEGKNATLQMEEFNVTINQERG